MAIKIFLLSGKENCTDILGIFRIMKKLYQVIQQVASGANRMVNERNPIVDARLNDGSRVNIILPPISIDGATMTIRSLQRNR